MRNVVAVMALLISVGGLFVSLAREEMRCYLGLANECGVPEKTTSNSTQKTTRERLKEESVSSPTRLKRTSESQPKATSEPIYKPEAVSETKELSEKLIEKETAKKSLIEPTKIQAIEVIPPPETANKSESIPLEVIPPPEEPQ